jgi:1-acyl-sn-glycerol-3-phosphate acyltransferase
MPQEYGKIRAAFTVTIVVINTLLWAIICTILAIFSKNAGLAAQRIWAKQLLRSFGVVIECHGLQNISQGEQFVFVSNHQSYLDIPSLMSVLPQHLTFIAKKELFAIPILGWGMAMVGHIPIDRSSSRSAMESLVKAVAKLKTGSISTVIFPEGTRSPDGNIGEFKRGSFSLPVKSGLRVVPIFLDGTGKILAKNSNRICPGRVIIRIGAPISPNTASSSAKEDISRLVLEQIQTLSRQKQS